MVAAMRLPVFLLLLLAVLVPWHGIAVVLPSGDLRSPRQPQVAVDAARRVHVVFGDGDAIFVTSGDAADLEFGPIVKVAEVPAKLALGMRRGPRIVAADGRLVVTAISHGDGNVHSWLSDDAGKTWRSGERINTIANSAREGLHAMAGDGRGLVTCVWLDLRGGGMEVWSRVSRDGGVTWEPEVRVYASPDGAVCTCCVPSVAVGPRGEIVAMWRNALGGARDMWMASSSDGGQTFGAARKLGEGTWKLNACPMDGGGLAFANGAPSTTWRREGTVFASKATGPEVELAAGAAQPVVASNAAKVAMLWEQGGALSVRVDAGAARVLAQSARMASVAPLGRGFVAVWEEPHGASTLLRAEIFE